MFTATSKHYLPARSPKRQLVIVLVLIFGGFNFTILNETTAADSQITSELSSNSAAPDSETVVTNLPASEEAVRIPWELDQLSVCPRTYPALGFESNGVQAVFFDGLPWKGKPTRVFAYFGIPAHKEGEKVPGIVLIHGGGGTAYPDWVRHWTALGYAAIAMDICGATPHGRHENGGPQGWGGFDQINQPINDQWTYHAVADVILAHTLLRSFPEVDADRVGMTGISWGGYLTCIVAGVDSRFRFAVPVYGCGFLAYNSAWRSKLLEGNFEMSEKWLNLWDPSRYLPKAKMPFLWVDGTNDHFYPLDSLQKSYRLTLRRTLCTRVYMNHSHQWGPEEIRVFADSILKAGPPLPRIPILGQGPGWVDFDPTTPIASAELNFTLQTGNWEERKWGTLPATVSRGTHKVTAVIPMRTTAYFFNLINIHGMIVSSELIMTEEGAKH